MINTKKIITCLYAGVVVASAMEDTKKVIFDCTENGDDIINFEFEKGIVFK